MNLISLAINPAPNGAAIASFDGYDGTKLRTALWQPTRGPARGTMCIFPGRGEYIEKYFEVIADLRRRGFGVAIMDWRGQGGSERRLSDPRKGHVIAFTEYDRDLAIFMTTVVQPNLPPPYIALGCSLGGNILLRNAQDEDSPFARMILVSPMIKIHDDMLGTRTSLARAYAETACLAGLATAYVKGGDDVPEEFLDFETNDLTSDPIRFARNKAVLEQSPNLALGSPTNGWLRSALRSCALLQRADYPKYVAVPMLMFAAGADHVVSARAIEDFAVDLKIGGHILMPGSRHEILQENDETRQRFWAAFDAYMGVDIPTELSA
ncbi:MAG: alpha/beta hydrolase [Hyphomicrobium sp.]|nr:MAG: alpha/beta hydrolase [Hyphomicrobium sp.]